MTQRWPWIRFALPARGLGRHGFRLTGGLANPNAVLEQIWNTLLRSVLSASPYFGKLPSGNFFQRIDADNPQTRPNAHYHLAVQ
jgi:hypothetical protein